MGGFLGGWLGPALNAATTVTTGVQEAQKRAAQERNAALMQQITQQRQEKDAELRELLTRSQVRENDAQAAAAGSAPKTLIAQDGTPYQIHDDGTFSPLTARAPSGAVPSAPVPDATDAPSDVSPDDEDSPVPQQGAAAPKFGTRKDPASVPGTPEWLAARIAAEKIKREFRAPVETPAQKRAAALELHKLTRSFDIANPMPLQDNTKPTEFSHKAALVYPRAAQAAEQLEEAFRKGMPAASLLGKVTPGQYFVPEAEQRANQAGETIATAILRLESGAAVSVDEARQYARQFLPRPGDSPEVRQQKRAMLHTQLERMKQAASPTMNREPSSRALPAGTPSGSGGPVKTAPRNNRDALIDRLIQDGKSDAEIAQALKGVKP